MSLEKYGCEKGVEDEMGSLGADMIAALNCYTRMRIQERLGITRAGCRKERNSIQIKRRRLSLPSA